MDKNNQIASILSLVLGIASISIIFFVNYQMIVHWFGKSGPVNIGSIEVSYVSMGRFLVDFGFPFPFLGNSGSWMPMWYFGFPFHLFYTPLLPMLEALINIMFQIPFWQSYRLLTGIAFITVPIGVFFLGWQLSKNVVGGLLAGLLYSVGPTLFYFLLPEVAADQFARELGYIYDPRRFTILVRWGEGPHLFSLMFLPVAGFFFARLLSSYRFRTQVLSALFLGLTALSNAIGFFSSLLLFGAMAFVDTARKKDAAWKSFFYLITTGLLSLGMISFWYNLSFLSNFFAEGGGTTQLLLSLFPWGWVGGILLLGLVFLISSKVIKDFGVMSSMLWFLILFTIVGGYYFSAPHEEAYRRIELFPQALRYMTEVDLSLSLLIGVIFGRLVNYFGAEKKIVWYGGNGLGLIFAAALVFYILPFFSLAAGAAGGMVDLQKTGEYEIASWLANNTDSKKGERVFIPGNYGFYLNYFTNVWQQRGGLYQAATHKWSEHIHYQMANGKDPEITKAWLVAINAKYAVLTGPRELYNEIINKNRFAGLNPVYENSGDTIYKVDLKRPSLAKPVSLSGITGIPPKKADDKERLLAYASWAEDSSLNDASFSVVNNDTYHIEGFVDDGEGILVQMTADPGWQATDVSGKKIATGKDALGFLMLYPRPPGGGGDVSITLVHGPTWKQWLGYGLTVITLFFIVIFSLSRMISRSKTLSTPVLHTESHQQ